MEEMTIENIMQYFITQGPFAARYDIVIGKLDEIKDRLPPK